MHFYPPQDSRPPSRTKPIPPKKPERLSLQRTTSLQNVEEGPTNTNAQSRSTSTSSSSRHHPIQTWPSLDTDIHCQERDFSQMICDRGRERPDYRSHENIYETQQECLPPSHNSRSWGHDHHHNPSSSGGSGSSSSAGDGSVMMVVSATPMVTAEPHGWHPAPQGASATTVTTTTTTLSERPRHHYHQYNHRQHSARRPLSPDASYHLDPHIPRNHDDARDIYSHTTTTTHYSAAAAATSHSHNHRSNNLHHHDHSHQKISTLSHHSHFTLHSPPTPVASRNSATLTMASSPRPHEQWC